MFNVVQVGLKVYFGGHFVAMLLLWYVQCCSCAFFFVDSFSRMHTRDPRHGTEVTRVSEISNEAENCERVKSLQTLINDCGFDACRASTLSNCFSSCWKLFSLRLLRRLSSHRFGNVLIVLCLYLIISLFQA